MRKIVLALAAMCAPIVSFCPSGHAGPPDLTKGHSSRGLNYIGSPARELGRRERHYIDLYNKGIVHSVAEYQRGVEGSPFITAHLGTTEAYIGAFGASPHGTAHEMVNLDLRTRSSIAASMKLLEDPGALIREQLTPASGHAPASAAAAVAQADTAPAQQLKPQPLAVQVAAGHPAAQFLNAVHRDHATVVDVAVNSYVRQHAIAHPANEVTAQMVRHLADALLHGSQDELRQTAHNALVAVRAQPVGQRDVTAARQKLHLLFAIEKAKVRRSNNDSIDAFASALGQINADLKELDMLAAH